jgi:hypothetical protein
MFSITVLTVLKVILSQLFLIFLFYFTLSTSLPFSLPTPPFTLFYLHYTTLILFLPPPLSSLSHVFSTVRLSYTTIPPPPPPLSPSSLPPVRQPWYPAAHRTVPEAGRTAGTSHHAPVPARSAHTQPQSLLQTGTCLKIKDSGFRVSQGCSVISV